MRNVVSISLPGTILKQLEREVKEEGSSRSEIVKRSLSRYFFSHDLARARNRAIGELARKGVVVTDEEVFQAVS